MLQLSVPWWELILRATVVYGFLLLILRLTGKRQSWQLAPFDLVLLLILSNAVQNAMNAGDNSLLAGLISATTLVLLNAAFGYLTYRSKRFEEFVEGQPEILVHNGKIYQAAFDKANITQHELHAAMRRVGCTTLDEVKLAMLENNGAISVIAKSGGGVPSPTAAPPSAS